MYRQSRLKKHEEEKNLDDFRRHEIDFYSGVLLLADDGCSSGTEVGNSRR
jgi:hypothetical protein